MQSAIQTFSQQSMPLIAIIDIEDNSQALATIRALSAGGINAVEIPLRHANALSQLNLIKQNLPDISVWAGTVTNAEQLYALENIGINLAISPGITSSLLHACQQTSINLLPGVTSASEIMLGMEYGLEYFKFFPAEASGGIATLKALRGPFQQAKFCATGGIHQGNMLEYLALDNVFAVAGSWLVDQELVNGQHWQQISQTAQQACSTIAEAVSH